MVTGFTRLGGRVLLRVAAELEMEADVDLSVLPVPGVGKPQCREHLANRPYGILSRAGSYWTAVWGDVPSPVVLGEDVKEKLGGRGPPLNKSFPNLSSVHQRLRLDL